MLQLHWELLLAADCWWQLGLLMVGTGMGQADLSCPPSFPFFPLLGNVGAVHL